MSCANVADYLLEGKPADAVALRMLDRDCSYGELEQTVRQVVRALTQTASRGDRVLVIGENSQFWVSAYLGTIKAGLVSVPLPASISPDDLAYVITLLGARLAFVESRAARRYARELNSLQVITELDAASGDSPGILKTCPSVEPDDLATLMFTSGSTRRPRGVMVSHRNIMANTASIIKYLGLTGNDRIMTVLPFHYCYGLSLLHTHLRVGASLVLDSRFAYPEVVLQRMADAACTGFAGVPSHFQILLRKSTLKARAFPHLRYVQQAGGHLPPAFVRELRDALPTTQIFIMYGQTEATARLSYLPPEFLDTKAGSIGIAIPGVTLRVLNDTGEQVRTGEVGEIVAEGENVTRGYWGDPHESAESFRDGKLYTGDLATVDDDGFIYVVDRARDFLKCGGKRVGTQQLEDQLLECGEVIDAAVVAMGDPVLGEAAKAYVVSREPSCGADCSCSNCRRTKELIMEFCRRRMVPDFVPREIVLLEALPRNSAGKVVKARLKPVQAVEAHSDVGPGQ